MTVPVFVNQQCLHVQPESTIRSVLAQLDPAWATALDQGSARLTDGRGIALDPDRIVDPGGIIRIAHSARRPVDDHS